MQINIQYFNIHIHFIFRKADISASPMALSGHLALGSLQSRRLVARLTLVQCSAVIEARLHHTKDNSNLRLLKQNSKHLPVFGRR